MSSIRFFCVICGTALHASPESQGDVTECSSCARQVPVPRLVNLPGRATGCLPAFPPEVLELAVKFLCTHCGRRLRVDARWEGREIVCPVCNGKTAVPRWSRAPTSGETPVRATRAPVDLNAATLSIEEIDFLRGPGTSNPKADP